MKTLAFSSLLLLSGFSAFGQNPSELFDKAPPAIDDALHARVIQFYDLFIAGKFKDAYSLVADDSQDKFFELSKDQYKSCEVIKIRYSDNFTKADWRWHGTVTLTTFPLTSNWEVIDGQWYWHWERPTMVPSPFSPTGFVPVPAESASPSLVPKDLQGAAREILAKVGIDKAIVRFRSLEPSQEVVHVRNDMAGQVSLKLIQPNVPGLKVSLPQTVLQAHEQTAMLVEWQPESPAKRISGHPAVQFQLQIEPTGQLFPINVVFDSVPAPVPAPPQK
jgi:hypothetical protein